jgi:hypothetical protein
MGRIRYEGLVRIFVESFTKVQTVPARNALFALDNTVALQESWQRYSETEKELATWLMCGNLNAIFDIFAETTATTSHSEMDIADLSVSFIEHRRRASLVAGYVAQHGV